MVKIHNKPLRYAHAEGHTDVCYSEDGKYIITCGHDGDVRIWLDIEDDDPNSHCVGESATAVCFKDKRLLVATGNHAVQAYTFPAFDKDGVVTRFTAPVTQIMTSSKVDAVALSSENMEAKICSPEGGAPLLVMTEHKGPVLSVAICPQMKFTATASGDGMIRIWDIDMQSKVKEFSCVPKINTFYAAKVLCRMNFEPCEGKYLAYPSNREVVLLDTVSWGQRLVFTQDSIKCAISQCLFSPCGQYLAGSTIAGQIAIWDVDAGACMGIVDHPTSHNVSAMAWNPLGNGMLVYCDVAGQMGMLENCYGKLSRPAEADAVEMVGQDDNDDMLDNLIERYESDDDNAISLDKIKHDAFGLNSVTDSRPASRHSVPARTTMPAQSAFQPSATPLHLEHRYMCWNEVGIVRCHADENGESNIDVEFHDTSVHHGIHLKNYLNHTMASLSTTVLALACPVPSKLVCISLVGSSKEWSISLPDVEEAVSVLATPALVVMATNARYLRLFTAMGTQRQVISLPGPVVTLTGYHTCVFAIYHSTDPGENDQHMAMDIIAINGRQVRSKTVSLPLSTGGARLQWSGVTDVGSPVTYDSTGVMRLYDVASAVWIPLCDTNIHSKGASDSWFIVSVSESSQSVRAILCRGAMYPVTVPKPIVTELPMQMNVCGIESEQGALEEKLWRWTHVAADVDVREARETALKLFALACRSEIEQRALELMDLLKDEKLLPLAAKYASRLGRMHLAEKLTELAENWHSEDKHNAAQHSHFEALDTQETYDVANSDFNASLILPARPKENRVEGTNHIKPAPMKSSPSARNPFRKQQESSKALQSPLSLTERTLVETHQEQQPNTVNGHPTDENIPQERVNIATETSKELQPPATGEAYPKWFIRNTQYFEKEYPELTRKELTATTTKIFKSYQSNVNSNGVGQKRKLDDVASNGDSTTPVSSAPKTSKLSAFAFKKKTDV